MADGPAADGPVVSDTTPLITLAGLGLLDLLPRLYGPVWIPEAVRAEYDAGRRGTEPALEALPWACVVQPGSERRRSPLVPLAPLTAVRPWGWCETTPGRRARACCPRAGGSRVGGGVATGQAVGDEGPAPVPPEPGRAPPSGAGRARAAAGASGPSRRGRRAGAGRAGTVAGGGRAPGAGARRARGGSWQQRRERAGLRGRPRRPAVPRLRAGAPPGGPHPGAAVGGEAGRPAAGGGGVPPLPAPSSRAALDRGAGRDPPAGRRHPGAVDGAHDDGRRPQGARPPGGRPRRGGRPTGRSERVRVTVHWAGGGADRGDGRPAASPGWPT